MGGEHSSKEPFEHLVISYSEHLHMSARPVENARDNFILGDLLKFSPISSSHLGYNSSMMMPYTVLYILQCTCTVYVSLQGNFCTFCRNCFICRPSESTVPEDVGMIEPRTVASKGAGHSDPWGRAQHDFSLAWLEATWYSSGSGHGTTDSMPVQEWFCQMCICTILP